VSTTLLPTCLALRGAQDSHSAIRKNEFSIAAYCHLPAGVSTAELMQLAGERKVELDFYLENLEHDRQTLESLNQ